MKLKEIRHNILFKITSLNAIVITIRLIISLFVQRLLALVLGESGIAKIGQLRNIIEILSSTATLGTFNGVVKYVSEYKDNSKELSKLFSTAFVFGAIGALISSILLISLSHWLSVSLFGSRDMSIVIIGLALVLPFIALNKFFNGIINGLSEYKTYAKIDLLGYLFSVILLITFLYSFNLKGVLIAIVLSPIIQLVLIVFIFGRGIKKHIKRSQISFKIPYAKQLFAFTLMSFVSTVLINYIELDIRTMITNKINENEAGYWTAMSFISKNYMVFSSGIFTLYVIPKFARIYDFKLFKKEVKHIYKTILPLFGLGMLLVYVFRETVINIIYPNFEGMEPLFKWQLLGDFIRLATLIISHQFLAKKMVKSFVITEFISLGLFYFLAKCLVVDYGIEGVVMAHFIRYIIYFFVVVFALWYYFKNLKPTEEIKNKE